MERNYEEYGEYGQFKHLLKTGEIHNDKRPKAAFYRGEDNRPMSNVTFSSSSTIGYMTPMFQ